MIGYVRYYPDSRIRLWKAPNTEMIDYYRQMWHMLALNIILTCNAAILVASWARGCAPPLCPWPECVHGLMTVECVPGLKTVPERDPGLKTGVRSWPEGSGVYLWLEDSGKCPWDCRWVGVDGDDIRTWPEKPAGWPWHEDYGLCPWECSRLEDSGLVR